MFIYLLVICFKRLKLKLVITLFGKYYIKQFNDMNKIKIKINYYNSITYEYTYLINYLQ